MLTHNNPIYVSKLKVRTYDIVYGKHVGYDRLPLLLSEARVSFLKEHGYSEINIQGTGIIIVHLEITYEKEMLYGDTLEIAISLANLKRASLDMLYSVKNQHGESTASAETTLVFIDYTTHKIVNMPPFFKSFA